MTYLISKKIYKVADKLFKSTRQSYAELIIKMSKFITLVQSLIEITFTALLNYLTFNFFFNIQYFSSIMCEVIFKITKYMYV